MGWRCCMWGGKVTRGCCCCACWCGCGDDPGGPLPDGCTPGDIEGNPCCTLEICICPGAGGPPLDCNESVRGGRCSGISGRSPPVAVCPCPDCLRSNGKGALISPPGPTLISDDRRSPMPMPTDGNVGIAIFPDPTSPAGVVLGKRPLAFTGEGIFALSGFSMCV